MAQLSSKIIKYLDREVDFTKDVLLSDDMIDGVSNPYIKEWNVAEAQPTDAQLNALESQANTLDDNNQVIVNRKAEYPSIEECVHAILDDDLVALQEKRTIVKNKYPKG